MNWFLGIDGGGTKTRCIVGREDGSIVADFTGPSCQHQILGPAIASKNLEISINTALQMAGISLGDLSFALLGLSGADFPEDFALLEALIQPILDSVPFEVVNDCWIALEAGTDDGYGAVSICGTGTNAAARGRDGRMAILRSQNYTLGNYGGGIHAAVMALHAAFRSEEGTGEPSLLEERIPPLLGCTNMEGVFRRFYFTGHRLESEEVAAIAPLLFDLAENEGDRVCMDILENMGREVGRISAGVVRRAGLEREAFPIVLAGSLHEKGGDGLFRAAFLCTLRRVAPHCIPVVANKSAAEGAFLGALRRWRSKSKM